MFRAVSVLFALVLAAACTPQNLDQPPPELGDFKLGHNVVIASKMQKGPVSREATQEEWTSALKQAVDARFGRYQGDGLYHFGISVEGYMLAPPGVPLVYTPKSALILNVTVWDDAKGRKLNSKPYQVAVLESTGQDSILIGSGWGRDKELQISGLSYNAIFAVEKWLVDNHETLEWFVPGGAPKEPPKQETPAVQGF